MPSLHIFSWNAQGGSNNRANPQTDAKNRLMMQNVVDRIDDEDCLILLQEAGSPGTTGYRPGGNVDNGFTCIYSREDIMAINQRCSIAILANFDDWEPADRICTGYTGRVVPVLKVFDKLYIATAHMVASGGAVAETTSLLDTIIRNAGTVSWFLAGDFNSEPSDHVLYGQTLTSDTFNTIMYSGTRSRPKRCQVFKPGTRTQGARGRRINTYDYAFCSETVNFNLIRYENILVRDEENRKVYSDHNMMYYELALP